MGNALPVRFRTDPHHHAFRASEGGNCFPKPKIFRRIGEGNLLPGASGTAHRFEAGSRPGRQLGRDQHHCPLVDVWKQSSNTLYYEFHIGLVVIVHRCIVRNPDDQSPLHCGRKVRGERELPPGQTLPDQFLEPRLENGGNPLLETIDGFLVEIDACDIVAGFREARRGDRTQVPKTEHAYVHSRTSSTHGFPLRYSSVRRIPSRIVSFGIQPNSRILRQSRKMKGLSPIHPRSPPV